jgi:type II secretory pathway component PulF
MRRQALGDFYRGLSRMLEAGNRMPEALLAQAPDDGDDGLAGLVAAGVPFSEALTRADADLPAGHARLIAIAEANGSLSRVLAVLAEEVEAERRIVSRLLQAAAYPLLVFAVLLAVAAGFAGRLLPTMAELAAAFDPAASARIRGAARLLGVLTPLGGAGLLGVAGAAAAARAAGRRLRRPDGSRDEPRDGGRAPAGAAMGLRLDEVLLRLPGAGRLLRARRLSVLFLALEVGTAGGAPLEEAMEAAAEAVPGPATGAACRRMARELRAGGGAAEVLGSCRLLPAPAVRWISVSERGVPFSSIAAELRARFSAELDTELEWLVRIAEPLLIVAAGLALAAFVAVAVLPLLEVYGGLLP